jgi:hypothetical protein
MEISLADKLEKAVRSGMRAVSDAGAQKQKIRMPRAGGFGGDEYVRRVNAGAHGRTLAPTLK